MKLSDFILHYPSPRLRDRHGFCRVRLFLAPPGPPVAVLTEPIDHDLGPSVTNAVEVIVQTLRQRGYVPDDCRFIDHFEKRSHETDTFDAVAFSPNGRPSWQSLPVDAVIAMLGCTRQELATRTADDPRLAAEMDRARQALAPHASPPPAEPPSVVRRRAEIAAAMLPKATLAAAIEAGSGERAMQQLIRRDLSLLGEVYGKPDDEYICFAEFPLADGFVDFAVFTGRSRMDVFLIEIKGADFNLMNAGPYREFNARINRAASQIYRRHRAIGEDMPAFRRSFHERRLEAEAGRAGLHAFLGPRTPLQVSADKDVNIHGVVIGGRRRDDLAESRQRQDYEFSNKQRIRIESWDSWLHWLRRE